MGSISGACPGPVQGRTPSSRSCTDSPSTSTEMELVDKGWVSGSEAYLQANHKHKFDQVKAQAEQAKDIE